MTSFRQITVVVPSPERLHEHALRRIADEFELVTVERADPALLDGVDRSAVKALAGMATIGVDFIDALPELQIIANFGVGYDAVDADHAASRGIMVTNTPDVLNDEVADTTVGLLLSTLRELPKAEAWLRSGRWVSDGAYPLTRGTLRGRSVGIFGLGRIGLAVAKRLEAFGVPISYHNRRKVEGVPYRYHASLEELARNVDTLISVAPGGAATLKAIDARIFAALGPEGVFVNIGRGSTVDEDALAQALRDGTILAAGLDVFADEPNVPAGLLAAENACLLPHVGSSTQHTRTAMSNLVVDNLVGWFGTGRVLTPVPETAHIARKG